MGDQDTRGKRRLLPVALIIRRALGRPYLFMAAVVLVVGAIWFARLALEEFLLIDRLVNVYTNNAQVEMATFAITPRVTAEVLDVLVKEGEAVHKGQELIRLAQDDILTGLHKAEAVAEGIQQQIHEMRLQIPLAIERAQGEVNRARAGLEAKERTHRRAQVLLTVERDRTEKMLREHGASLEAARARVREHEAAWHEAEVTWQRTQSLFNDGILSQERLDTARLASARAQARLAAAQEQVRQVQEHYPSRDSPQMIRVHETDLQRQLAEVKAQRAALDLSQTDLRLAEVGKQGLKVLEAKYQEAQAEVASYRLQLAKTVIRSPADGIIGYRNIEPGEIVEGDPSNPPILIIHDPRSSWIEAHVWESDIRRVRAGRPVEVWIDAFKNSALGRGTPFRGRVLGINPTTYSEVAGLPPERFFSRRERKVPVKIALEDVCPGLRAGMLAEVLILLNDGAVAQESRRAGQAQCPP
ncbi:p-hydroxybenzoic acid efflux pump subunit AaeA [Candidatus Entotheonellaceae bacterium PAL068K]